MKKIILSFFILMLFIECSYRNSNRNSFVLEQDSIKLRAFTKKWDINFDDNWNFKKSSIGEINHFVDGIGITWVKKTNEVKYIRTYIFNLDFELIIAHEQRFINDTLLSQGYVNFKNRQVEYIIQIIINKESLKKDGLYWTYDVCGHYFEIYNNGILECKYKANVNHYYMLFEKQNKDKIELVSGKDCLNIKKE